MTAKEFLRRARCADRRVDEATERVMRIRARLEAGRMTTLSDMPRGGASDWTDTANALVELEKDMNARIREMVREKRLAMEAIAAVEEANLREVLELYYLDGFTWEKVADIMGYDVRHITRLHGKALLKIRVPDELTDR